MKALVTGATGLIGSHLIERRGLRQFRQVRTSSWPPRSGQIKTKRWNDPAEHDDGHRLFVCRYRPRGLPKGSETWDVWWPQLGPSRRLHADHYGKNGPPIAWTDYRRRYLSEMGEQQALIVSLAARVAAGETITLLCSSGCTLPERCHRTLLMALVRRSSVRAEPFF